MGQAAWVWPAGSGSGAGSGMRHRVTSKPRSAVGMAWARLSLAAGFLAAERRTSPRAGTGNPASPGGRPRLSAC